MRRKPRRSRRIVKKLLKRVDPYSADDWHLDIVRVDGGKRYITGLEMRTHGFMVVWWNA